jgi:hypothetical protein
MVEMTDDQLLDQLRDVLTVTSVKPDDATMSRLYATLAELDVEQVPVVVAPVATKQAPLLRRKFSTRGSLLAAVAGTFFLTAGVAAAAVVTNTLPGFARNAAYDLGLPVTSPALVHTQYAIGQLQLAVTQRDPQLEQQWGTQVQHDLTTLDPSDLGQVSTAADTLLNDVGLTPPVIIGGSSPTTTTPGTSPSVTVPGVTVPGVTGRGVTVPGVSVPTVTVPTLTVPSVSVPTITVPTITVPTVIVPTVTVPSISVPTVTTPSVGIPPATAPKVTIPPVTVPITVPQLKKIL